MMKSFWSFVLVAAFILSCHNNKVNNNTESNQGNSEQSDSTKDEIAFFPVTDFIKGDVEKIKSLGKNPVKYFNNKENKPDSLWIKVQDFEKEFNEFYTPGIDSLNDSKYYLEKKFFDNTLESITLTYEPISDLPSLKPWTHWDIYINPETNLVTRIYLVKVLSDSSVRQLTWIPEKSCKAITIENKNNISSVKDEINIKW